MSYSVNQGVERLLYQYRDSPRVVAFIRACVAEYEILSQQNELLQTRLDIDLSVGKQLDGIGEIVGTPRPLSEAIDPDEVFTFDGDDGKGFSGNLRPDVGGRWTGINGLIIGPMPDSDYRILIKATIFANYADSTIGDLTEYVRFVLGENPVILPSVGYIDVVFPRALSLVELDIIDRQFPIAAGIGLRYQYFTQGARGFGFLGSNSTGFGGIGVPQDGAGFAGLLGV